MLILVCVVIGCLVIAFVVRALGGRNQPVPNAAQLKALEDLMLLRLPSGARTVAWSHESAVGDCGILLKLEILPSDLGTLIADSPFAQSSLSSRNALFYITGCYAWWDEGGKAERFLFGEETLPDDRVLQLMVDMDRQELYVVYLALFGS